MKNAFKITAVLLVLAWLVTTCSRLRSPLGTPTPTCYPMPQATGEKIIGPTLEATPFGTAAPGQTITVRFSGNYIIGNNAIICNERATKYVHSDQLPGFSWERTVNVLLDDQPLTTVKCDYTCQLEFSLPANTLPGSHQLTLTTNWERIVFDIQISKP